MGKKKKTSRNGKKGYISLFIPPLNAEGGRLHNKSEGRRLLGTVCEYEKGLSTAKESKKKRNRHAGC